MTRDKPDDMEVLLTEIEDAPTACGIKGVAVKPAIQSNKRKWLYAVAYGNVYGIEKHNKAILLAQDWGCFQ